MTSSPPDAPSPDDRREHPRAPIDLKVEYKRLNSFFADYTRNISKGGTFIVTAKPLPVDTEFLFRLVVPRLEQPLELHGRVAWIVSEEEATAEQPAGMGIRFQYRDDQERERVHAVVESLLKTSLGNFVGTRLLGQLGSDGGRGGRTE